MDLSIIIVNWNSAEYLEKCLKSIYDNTSGISFETIVVDNGSYDGCEDMLKSRFPRVIFVQSKENIGFARANNLGYGQSKGNTLLFLNPDTEVIDSAINKMLPSLWSISDSGALNCTLLNSDLSLQVNCIQPSPTLLNQVLGNEYLQLKFPSMKFYRLDPLFSTNEYPHKVDVVSGACLMVKRGVFERVGLFSDDYFMYAEDIDLCYKIRMAGYGVYHLPCVSIMHHGGSSSNKAGGEFGDVMIRESVFKFFVKTRGEKIALIYRMSMLFLSMSRLVLIAVLKLIAFALNRKDVMNRPYTKWKEILKWSMGLRKWAGELNRIGVSRL